MTRIITPHKGGRDARIPSGRIRQQTLDRIHEEMRERSKSWADLVEERWRSDETSAQLRGQVVIESRLGDSKSESGGNEMDKQSIESWREQIAKEYGTYSTFVVPANSLSALGWRGRVRRVLAEVKSPHGGKYTIFNADTIAREKQ